MRLGVRTGLKCVFAGATARSAAEHDHQIASWVSNQKSFIEKEKLQRTENDHVKPFALVFFPKQEPLGFFMVR